MEDWERWAYDRDSLSDDTEDLVVRAKRLHEMAMEGVKLKYDVPYMPWIVRELIDEVEWLRAELALRPPLP